MAQHAQVMGWRLATAEEGYFVARAGDALTERHSRECFRGTRPRYVPPAAPTASSTGRSLESVAVR
jgi:hypothetical protein